jgi:hypothetical protein
MKGGQLVKLWLLQLQLPRRFWKSRDSPNEFLQLPKSDLLEQSHCWGENEWLLESKVGQKIDKKQINEI